MGIETLIQGGAVGISISLIALVSKIWLDTTKHTNRVIDVVEKNATAIASLKGAIRENTQITRETKEMINHINGREDKENAG